MLSVCLAFAQLRKEAFEVACVPGYAFLISRFETTLTCCFTGASELRMGDNSSSLSPPGGVQRVMSAPIGMKT